MSGLLPDHMTPAATKDAALRLSNLATSIKSTLGYCMTQDRLARLPAEIAEAKAIADMLAELYPAEVTAPVSRPRIVRVK